MCEETRKEIVEYATMTKEINIRELEDLTRISP